MFHVGEGFINKLLDLLGWFIGIPHLVGIGKDPGFGSIESYSSPLGGSGLGWEGWKALFFFSIFLVGNIFIMYVLAAEGQFSS